jgi:hypothetical protein
MYAEEVFSPLIEHLQRHPLIIADRSKISVPLPIPVTSLFCSVDSQNMGVGSKGQ